MNYKRKSLIFIITLISCIMLTTGAALAIPITPASISDQAIKGLTVHYIDVGQADSILIQTPSGRNMLIDAGNNADSQIILTYLRDKKVNTIDVLVGTHPHEDHIGSMDDIIRSFNIGSIYMPKVSSNTNTFLDVLQAIKEKGLQVTTPTLGGKISIDSDLDVTILAPQDTEYKDLNDYSIVMKVTYKDNSFLFTGDAEAVSEAEILKGGYNIKSDVLKVGHHGSNSSTTDAFIKSVSPKYGIISVGKGNDYGHPAADTLKRLIDNKVEVYRTDEAGTIIATSDGSTIKIDKVGAPANTVAPATGQYIGNKNSKVFHLPTCGTLPQPQNQVKIISKDEAIKAGFTPCQRCKP